MQKNKLLLTGSSGFVGQRFMTYNNDKYTIQTASLQHIAPEDIRLGDVDVILHSAGMAHQMQKIDDQIYFDVNYTLTKRLADHAKAQKVKHFIFISTIKVFGEHQIGILNGQSPTNPINDPYGESKLKAEKYLLSIQDDNFKVAIIRPPLIYGPGVKGNLIRFLELGNKNIPLPFKNVKNRRTMVFLDNFIELINKIVDTKASGIFLAGDNKPISTEKLIAEIRKNLDKSPSLFTAPKLLIFILSKVKPELAIRLFESLEMNTTETNKKLDFAPPYSVEYGIKAMTDWYKTTLKR